MENRSEIKQARIAFVGYLECDKGASYRGGVLVTDEWGKPLEFRCSAPVRPTTLQRTLYGQSLLPHILVELIGDPLVNSLREKPEVIVIRDPLYFDLRHRVTTPVINLQRSPDDKGSHYQQNASNAILIESASGKFQQVRLEAHRKFPDDVKACDGILREVFDRWDLTEPFERLATGLEYIHEQKALEG